MYLFAVHCTDLTLLHSKTKPAKNRKNTSLIICEKKFKKGDAPLHNALKQYQNVCYQ